MINWLTNDQFPSLYKSEDKEIFPKRDLFLWAIMMHRPNIAKALWEIFDKSYIASALTASHMLKSMAKIIQNYDNASLSELHSNLTAWANWYENKARLIL